MDVLSIVSASQAVVLTGNTLPLQVFLKSILAITVIRDISQIRITLNTGVTVFAELTPMLAFLTFLVFKVIAFFTLTNSLLLHHSLITVDTIISSFVGTSHALIVAFFARLSRFIAIIAFFTDALIIFEGS